MAVLQINILGTSFALQAEEEPAYLEKIRDYYKNVCDEIQKNDGLTDQKQIAVLAGILIADELFKEKQRALTERDLAQEDREKDDELFKMEAERLTSQMIAKIDGALRMAGEAK